MPKNVFKEKWPRLQLLQIAKVEDLASSKPTDNIEDHDKAILDRIRKCNERAAHPNTSEAEKKAAMLLASKLMRTHNIHQADLINAAAAKEDPSTVAGQSAVGVYANKPGAKYKHETWANQAAHACTTFFDCKYYTTRRTSRLQWTFYGIAKNTAQAATSFEMIYNSIQEWSAKRRRKVKLHDYRMGIAEELLDCANKEREDEKAQVRQKEVDSLAAQEREEAAQRQKLIDRLNYQPPDDTDAHFFVGEEKPTDHETNVITEQHPAPSNYKQPTVEDEAPSEDETAAKVIDEDTIVVEVPSSPANDTPQINKDDNRENLDEGYLSDDSLSAAFSWDGFGDDESESEVETQDADFELSDSEDEAPATPFDATNDFEDELQRHMPASHTPEVVPPSPEDFDDKENTPADLTTFNNMSALALYYKNTEKIAEDYLKQQNLKLRSGRKRKYDVKDHDSYEAGRRDGKKIDAKRRRIEDVRDEDRPVIKEEIEIVLVEHGWVLVNFLG